MSNWGNNLVIPFGPKLFFLKCWSKSFPVSSNQWGPTQFSQTFYNEWQATKFIGWSVHQVIYETDQVLLDSSSFGTLFLVKEFEASLYFWDVRFWGLWLSDLWQSAVVTFISRGFRRKMSNILLNAWMHSIL